MIKRRNRISRTGAQGARIGGAPLPGSIFGPLDERSLRQPQGPRSGVSAIFGQLPDQESDEDIIKALDRLS